MFGGNRKKDDKPSSLVAAMTPENAPSSGGGRTGGGGGSSVTGFDPEGLERAAKAARELDASRNASAAIELIKTQEGTKQVRRSTGRGGEIGGSIGSQRSCVWFAITLNAQNSWKGHMYLLWSKS